MHVCAHDSYLMLYRCRLAASKVFTGGVDVIKWECVMEEYIKMSGRLLLYRFITTAKFNFLGCMLHNTLTEFSIFQTQASSFTHSVFLSHRLVCSIFFRSRTCRWILRLPLSFILFRYYMLQRYKRTKERRCWECWGKNEMLWKKAGHVAIERERTSEQVLAACKKEWVRVCGCDGKKTNKRRYAHTHRRTCIQSSK